MTKWKPIYFDLFKLWQSTSEGSLHLSDICIRKCHLRTQWQGPVTWGDWHAVNLNPSAEVIGNEHPIFVVPGWKGKLCGTKKCWTPPAPHTGTRSMWSCTEFGTRVRVCSCLRLHFSSCPQMLKWKFQYTKHVPSRWEPLVSMLGSLTHIESDNGVMS
jgi:hypothetical protein